MKPINATELDAASRKAKDRRQYERRKVARPLFEVWWSMKARCCRPEHAAWPCYGGLGISVAPAWLRDYKAFERDITAALGPRPSLGHSLDRRDPYGPYAIPNLRWASRREQARNRRDTRRLSFAGEHLLVVDLSARTGIAPRTLWHRWLRGDREERLVRPVRRGRIRPGVSLPRMTA